MAVGLNDTTITTTVGSVMKATSAVTAASGQQRDGHDQGEKRKGRCARPVEGVEPPVLHHGGDHLHLSAAEEGGRRIGGEGPRKTMRLPDTIPGADRGRVT